MKRRVACCVAVVTALFLAAGAAAHSVRPGISPLLGAWRGDIVRIHNGAIIGRNVLTLRIGSARVGSMFKGELPRPPACTAQFRIAKRTDAKTWVVGLPRTLAGDGANCALAGFSDAYTKDAFKLILLDNRRLRLVGLSRGVRVQATLFHPR